MTAEKELRRWKQRKARRTVQYSVEWGRLTKLPCEVCGDPESQAHHEDYDKPLEVVWLCRKHHQERHHEISHERYLVRQRKHYLRRKEAREKNQE